MSTMKQDYLKINSILNFLIFKIIIVCFLCNFTQALENKILFKIDNEIVTTVDISNEINYLKATNKQIKQLDDDAIINIAKNSIIKDKLKKIELLKRTKTLQINEEYLNAMVKNTYENIGLTNIIEFNEHLDYHDLKIEIIEEKIRIDTYWKQMIYNKYKDKLKVDRDKILKEISNKKVKKYQLSEILFDVGNKNKLEEKYNIIKKSISQNGFENTALMYGISDTSKNGGKLGWINETAISDKILNQISSLSIGGFTKPITVPGGFLILKINNISEEQIKTDKEKEVEKIVNIKINEQLNQFSNLYLNKIKKDVILSGL